MLLQLTRWQDFLVSILDEIVNSWNNLLALRCCSCLCKGGSIHRLSPDSLSFSSARHEAAPTAAKSSHEHKSLWGRTRVIFIGTLLHWMIEPLFFFSWYKQKQHLHRSWWIEETHKLRMFSNLSGLSLLLLLNRKLCFFTSFCCCSGSAD